MKSLDFSVDRLLANYGLISPSAGISSSVSSSPGIIYVKSVSLYGVSLPNLLDLLGWPLPPYPESYGHNGVFYRWLGDARSLLELSLELL